MKTHIPATLRKALIAALFAVSSVAYNAQAAYNDDFNVGSDARNSVTDTYLEADALGYVDFTFSGLNPVLGTAHFTHSAISVDYYTRLVATVGSSGKYEFHTLKADQGRDPEYDIHSRQYIGEGAGYYSTSWSNGNINVQNEAVMEVTASITANGAININGASRVTAGNKVTAGEINLTGSSLTTGNISVSQNDLWVQGDDSIKSSGALSISGSNANVTATGTVSAVGAVNVSKGAYLNADKVAAGEINVNNSSLTAGNITVTKNPLWVAGGDPIDSSGELRLSGSNANVTATGTVSAAGGVDVSSGAHLNASNINSTVGGNTGYVCALPGENLKVALVASEGTQYIVDNGCTITLGGIGELVNEGTDDDPQMVMHGNGNYFGYGEDSNNIKADAIYVLGDIISDNNELVALGNAVYDHEVDPNSSAIYVKGSITGKGNELFVRNQDAAGIWVAKDISGDNNSLITNSGDIHVAGTLGRSKDSDDGAAKGNSITAGDDITIHQLSDNEKLTIDAMNGELTIEEASEATLLDSSITAADDVVIAANAAEGSDKKLQIINTNVTSEMGDIISHQVISANGAVLTAEEGAINVYSLTYDPTDEEHTGIQVTTQNLIAEKELKLDGTEKGSFDSFVTVTEDMRTTEGSISITNFTDKDKVNVGHNIESADSITVKNVNGMLVGTEDEDGIGYEGSMTAKNDIRITDSDVHVLGDQTAETGKIAISVTDPTADSATVTVDGDQLAGNGISVADATLTVGVVREFTDIWGNKYSWLNGGDQTADTGDISITNSTVDILGHQEATAGSIGVFNSELMVGAIDSDGEIVQASNQTANQDIEIVDSIVHVLGNQIAEQGRIAIQSTGADGTTPSEVTIGGDQTAHTDIIVTDSTLEVGTIEEVKDEKTGEITYKLAGGNQTAETGDITIDNSTVDILGHQDATTGSISVTGGSDLTVGAMDPNGEVVQASNQTAQQDIKILDSKVAVLGNQEATEGEIVISADPEGVPSLVYVGGDQKAGTDITLTTALTAVKGDQTAGGSIAATDTMTLVNGDQTAAEDITVIDSIMSVGGDQTATAGAIAISSTGAEDMTLSEVIIGGNQEAGTDISVTDSTLTVGTIKTIEDEETGEITYELNGGNQTAETGDITIDNSTVDILGHQEATAGSISVTGGSDLTVGAMDPNGEVVQASNQTALQDIKIVDSEVSVLGDQTSTEGSIVITVGEDGTTPVVTVDGDQEAGDSILTFGADLTVGYIEEIVDEETGETSYKLHGGNQTADNGNIGIVATEATVRGNVTATGEDRGLVFVLDSTYDVGTSLTANELSIGTLFEKNASVVTINLNSATVEGEPLETVLDVDTLKVSKDSTLHTGNVKMDAADVTIHGIVEAGVKDYEDPTNDIAADWKVTGSHDISGADAHLMANGDIEIVATEEGDAIRIADGAKVSATGNVTIQGLAAALAEVDNATVRATGDIIFDRAELTNNHDTDITTMGGDIVLKNRVEISDTMLNVLPTEEGKEGVINVAEGADVQLYQGTVGVFNGALAGTGTVTANDENLVISHDSPGFNGRINMVRDNEQTLYIGSKGVGDKAVLSMQKGSSLATRIGGQDANLGNVVTTDGSFIQMNAVDKGNRTTATSLNLTAGTTYELFATTDDTTGALLADTITVSNGINANGARVRAHSDTPLEALADGSRFTIAGGSVVSGFNEDVLYDMVQPDAGSKRTARALQTRNMHLEHTAHGVDLVVSENYKAIDDRNTNAAAVRDVILPLDAAADHRPGKLAGSASQLDHVLDALDYTRSGADAREGLLSLSGAANLIVPNMMMDASRHHLSALRDHMSAPVCNKDRKTKGNVWAAYIGGYDHIGGDENMHAYSHSYQGALVGGDYAVNCNWAVGLSLGYQKSIARTVGTRADADAISGDLYAVGRTGKYTHRFSMGLTSYSTDVKRGTRIAAAGHTYHGQSTGSADGMSWNFGYQLSRNFAINQVSTITPYLTVDVALQRIDTLNEKGQGDASVVTDYEDFVQTDAALGVAYSHTFTSFNRQAGVVSVNLAAHGEFSEHRATAKNHFAGYADTWKTRSMKRAPFYGELGADVVVPFGQHISGTAGVNFEFSADRTFVGGHAGVNYRF